MLKGKKEAKQINLTDYQYGLDRSLYLHFTKYSMDPGEYYKDSGKYQDNFYPKAQYLFKVDEGENTLTEMPLPEMSAESFYKKISAAEVLENLRDDEVTQCMIDVLQNGDYFISSMDTDVCGLYSRESGEKIAQGIDMSKVPATYTNLVVGDEFYAIGVGNNQTKRVEVNVYDQDGDLMQVLPTGITYDESKLQTGESEGILLGASENTILLATPNGIYEADYGDEEFTQVVDAKADNFYYLSSDYRLNISATVLKGNEEDYYLQVYKAKMSDVAERYLCRYVKK